MSTSDERQHAPEPQDPTDEAVEPVTGTAEPAAAGVDGEQAVTVTDEKPAPDGEGGPAEDEKPLPAPDEVPAIEKSGAPEPAAAKPPASMPEPGPSPVPPPPGAAGSGPTPVVPPAPPSPPATGAPTAPVGPTAPAAWRPPTPTPALGTAAPVRPPMPAPAPADEDATARHAALRPSPVPPEPAAASTPPLASGLPQRTPPPAGVAGAAGLAAGAAAAAAGSAGAAAHQAAGAATSAAGAATSAATAAGAGEAPPTALAATTPSSSDLFPDPNAPRTITVGTHVLGVVVGVLLPLASALVTVLGISRILAVEADGWVAKVDVLGIVLVTLGALLLLACALLSLWTPSVGLVGGGILTLAGGFALYAPGLTRAGVLDVLTSEGWEPTVVQSVVVATSGTLLVVGVLLLGAGIVSSAARRHGIHLGAFRERHRA